jgi:serine/threonine protein kinase
MMTSIEEHWNHISKSMIDKVIDQYQLVEELGRGSYGCLFLGQSMLDNSYVAVKILCKKGLDESQLLLQQLEIDIQSSLKHPYLLGLDHVIQEQDYVFMIMELCDGGDLFEFVVSHPSLNDQVIKSTFCQILDAVEYMHQNHIYHRDIKLENILLQQDTVCKVADFGLATKERYSLDFGCGSTTYLGPEHFSGSQEDQCEVEFEPYDAAASDIWSLGILLLALLFGRNPWQEATLEDLAFAEFNSNPLSLKTSLFPELSNDCLQFLQSVLCVDPLQRTTIQEMKQQFIQLKTLTVDYNDDDDDDDDEILPLDIHPVQPNKPNKASYDSAIFSQDGLSWSDMVEEDILLQQQQCHDGDAVLVDHFHDNDDEDEDYDDDLFIHSQEKESWWL